VSSSERATVSGLLNEAALVHMVQALDVRVSSALLAGRFPVLYGADCAVLLGAIPALRGIIGEAGLIFLDGHEDATPMELSPDGEFANMEIALLLGLTGQQAPEAVCSRLPALRPEQVAMLGPRDEVHRAALGVPTVADRVLLRTPDQMAVDPERAAREAVTHVARHTSGWWLHIDLDVLAKDEFAAYGAAGESPLPGGLSWAQLTETVSTALRTGGCRGWSLSVYNPDQDPNGSDAARLVEFIDQITADWP
jgi:arginase